MHAVLALSALHFGHMNPSQKEPFTLASIRHQNLAVTQFASHLSNINSDNCHAAVLFASFTFITTMFSFTNRYRDGVASLDDIVQCFILVQGVYNILASPTIWSAITSGPIAPLVSMPPPAAPPVGAFAARLKALVDIVRPPPMSPSNETALSSSSSVAVEALQAMYVTMCAEEEGKRVRIWSWPISLEKAFVERLRRGEPVALVVLVHYAAMVRCYEKDAWYLKGWSEAVSGVVEEALAATGEEWRQWIQWPIRCIAEGADVREMGKGGVDPFAPQD